MPELILAIDVGTTSARAAVLEPGGALAGLSAKPLATLSPESGRALQDADTVWAATRHCVEAALAAAGRAPSDLAAIGLTTQRASAVIWDRASGAPLSPLVLWSDVTGEGRAAELRAAGFPLAPQQAATKLEAMMLTARGDARARRLAWGALDSYLLFRLTGGAAHVTDRSQAWPTGYLGFPGLGWNDGLIAHQGLDQDLFPTLVDTWGPMAVTDPAVLGAAVPITADIADQQSALLAHGEAPGTAKVSCGTSATFNLATGETFLFPAPGIPPLIASSVGGATRFCVEGMVLSAGAAVDWARDRFGLGDPAAFDALAASVSDAGGAAFLPALQGLGAPHGDPARRAALAGLSASVGRGQIARAVLEGIAFRVREIVLAVYAATPFAPPEALGLDGGLARSDPFVQALADLTGLPVRRHAALEATLLGAAIAAGRGAGLITGRDEQAMIRFEPPITPQISAAEGGERFGAWKASTGV